MDGKIAAYRHADTMGKSQVDLILMVYDGALKALKAAAKHYRDDDNDAGFEQIQHAKRFVTHLYTTLDVKKGGEVAENLSKMYVWALSQLCVVEATKELEQLDSVVKVLDNLRSGWADLKEQQGSTAPETSAPTSEASEIPELTEEFTITG
jgi:flagellar protein FliS